MNVLAKAAAALLVSTGLVATATAVVATDPTAPPAQAVGLERFDSCEALRQWYVTHALDEVGPWGWGGRPFPMATEELATTRAAEPAAGGSPDQAVSNGATGTNTQEVGVDEPDVAKTDGRIVVRLVQGRRLVITDVTGAEPRQLSSWQLPFGTYAEGLLLVDDHAVLSGGVQPVGREGATWMPGSSSTQVIDVDLSDPTDPQLVDRHSWTGRTLSLRQYDDTIRLVTSLGLPPLRFVQPRPGALSEGEAERKNREIVESTPVEDWIPGLPCDRVFHPRSWAGPETVTVSTFRLGALDEADDVAVTGAGSEVYSSPDRLYVTSTGWSGNPIALDSSTWRGAGPSRTQVHAFALDGDTTRYVASGSVDGTVRDRWSLDEQDGHLRVAVSWPDRRGGTAESGVVVLDERAGRLDQVGELRGLGVDEDIQSVRWFDDLAVVVTFRRTDPLYTIDLSDPTRPTRLGALKIPGFSSYLHPIGGDRLLGIGSDATDQGENLGAQAAVFDVRDLTDARRVDTLAFGRDSWFEAAGDPHAFTWLPGADAAITFVQTGLGSGPVLLRVAPDGTLTAQKLPPVGDWGSRALPLPDGRVALAGDRIEIVEVG